MNNENQNEVTREAVDKAATKIDSMVFEYYSSHVNAPNLIRETITEAITSATAEKEKEVEGLKHKLKFMQEYPDDKAVGNQFRTEFRLDDCRVYVWKKDGSFVYSGNPRHAGYYIGKQAEQLSSQQAIISELQVNVLKAANWLFEIDALSKESSILRAGLCEIIRIKGNPPIQVARTIAIKAFESLSPSSPSNPVEAKPRPIEPPKLSGKQYGSVDEMMNNSITTEKGKIE